MCEEHVAAGIPCPSVESIGSAILAAPRVIAGTVLGVSAAVALSFVVENFVWFALGAAVLIGAALTVLVRKTHRTCATGGRCGSRQWPRRSTA